MAVLTINDLVAEASVGVNSWEKQVKQKLVFDLAITTDVSKAAESDDIADTLNYNEVCQSVCGLLANQHFNLIETVAAKTKDHIKHQFGVDVVSVKVTKRGAVAGTKSVAIAL